ncbi:MAG: 3-deoxy-8-phosphooctulonate synthase [Ignavibacteria bacterium]|nr:3-deoxy-8-phosphooctulonate synthase [Ignavibacteria bacterium]MBT8383789.1 3-deoxy-8-phosphooctulonate synthase [Ignavibacteria bacterium]MBT8390713.1 3-deoxy-8-phosphooctulonate synthase [Ignavibacteria bacterium]NNJ53664.1 3-deoxy-8-phosphooctulonate synthase [Ignavibacteriaceae bacterium]NNL22516.1 3-deoxy-8-phosphooctulonate synthase [Ignavibacteriaceae bacterium]
MIEIEKIKIGDGQPFVLIAGPCVVENEKMILESAAQIKKITSQLNIPFIFKSSYKKANRTSLSSFKGIGDQKAISILKKVKEKWQIPVLTDVHNPDEINKVLSTADIIQIPAFLSRQTELLLAAGKSGKAVNVKKGQFLAPDDMEHVIEKIESTGNKNILLTERGTSFGYHNLVVDMRSLVIMKQFGYPVVMDATHSVQLPANSSVSGGQPQFIKPLAKAAAAVGIDALFLEVHPNPKEALSDAQSQLPLVDLENILIEIKEIDAVVKKRK